MDNTMTLQKFSKYRKEELFKKDLQPIHNFKIIFNDLRDYFAGNVTGISRDESIVKNMIRLIFIKIYDEINTEDKRPLEFQLKANESLEVFHTRINKLFSAVIDNYNEIFDADEQIELNSKDLAFIVSKIEDYSILTSERDVVGDLFEEIIGRSFRGGEGQFFTPKNIVKLMVGVCDFKSDAFICDPACGAGGFLTRIYESYSLRNAEKVTLKLYGIEKDRFLSKLARIHLNLLSKYEKLFFKIFCQNSLENPEEWDLPSKADVKLNSFDLILTNPPFGAKIPVIGNNILIQYDLGHVWKKKDKKFIKTNKLASKQAPQILFIERCLQLLKKDGFLGIVLPEGIFGNPSDRYVWEYIKSTSSIIGIISLAQEAFQPSTHTKTSILFLKKTKKQVYRTIFMAVADSVGHNKNGKELYKINNDGTYIIDEEGNKILDDDLPIIKENFKKFLNNELFSYSKLGFVVNDSAIKDSIYIPEYYNPEITEKLTKLDNSGKYNLITINDLINKNIITISRGNEVGSQYYGTGTVPFVRTTDLVNWEIKFNPYKSVPEEIYLKYKDSQDIQVNDILFVSDGTFLIGRSSMVSILDTKIIIQSHIKKIRVEDHKFTDPYYLFYLLNTNIVQRQIEAKTFVQATISTLGPRINELVLPFLKNKEEMKLISLKVKEILDSKVSIRQKINSLINSTL